MEEQSQSEPKERKDPPPTTMQGPNQPPYYPPPPPAVPPPPYYYPPQPPPPMPVYSWEMYPNAARELMRRKEDKKPILILIGVFLLITFILAIPIASLFLYYSTSEGMDFGETIVLSGNIRDEDGTGISGARVSIAGTELSAISDAQGNYEIQSAPTGIWRIRVTLAGYKEEDHKVLVSKGFIDTIDFEMEEGEGKVESNELWFFISLAILILIFSCFVFFGAYYSFKRKRFAVVLVGAILGIFTMTPPMAMTFLPSIFAMGALGFILSLSALFMVIMNRKAFLETHESSEKVPGDPV